MIALLFTLAWLTQGISPLSTDSGTIAGALKTASGEAAPGIRIIAMARPESLADVASSASFAGLAETDENGLYRLENLPPGNYYIAAGRVDLPTYYPGTLEMLKGSLVSIASRAVVTNINFVLDEASVRRESLPGGFDSSGGLTLPVQVRMEGDAKQPVFSEGRSVMVRLTRVGDKAKFDLPLTDSIQNFPIPSSVPGIEYRVTVENLPKGFVLKSMDQDGVDLINNTLKITGKNFGYSSTVFLGATSPGAGSNLIRNSSAAAPMTPLEITMAAIPSEATPGVRVIGRTTSAGIWYLSLSGSTGILFADGSFEFRGVTAGRHVILLQNTPVSPSRILAASIVVGNKDLDDVIVDDTRVLPNEVRFPSATLPPGSIPLAWIHGRVSDDVSKDPVFGGVVTLTGRNRATFAMDSEGQFEIPRLLPGNYDLTIDGFQHATIHQNVTVGDEDIQLNVTARSSN